MSASSKKKLRKEQAAAALTRKQQAEKKEARKLKAYTVTFWIVLALCVSIVLGMVLSGPINGLLNSTITAVTVNNHKVSAVELNYFYTDAINEYCNTYSSILSYMLDTSKPLGDQIVDEATGTTWADNFVSMAVTNAKSTYALCDAAAAAGYTLSQEEQTSVDSMMSNLEIYAAYYGYNSANDYLAAVYGKGASLNSYRKYFEASTLASSFYANFNESLEYSKDDLRAHEKDKYYEYSSYSFASYYMKVDSFLAGGTKGADGTTTYSDEEKAAAQDLAKRTAEGLAVETNNTVAKLDAAIKALSINKDNSSAASTQSTNKLYSKLSSTYNEWLRDESRQKGDITCIPYETTSTVDGEEVKTVVGYYIVLFLECNDNTYGLANVRHILVPFEGGTTDSSGNTTYSDAEKQAAKDKAFEILDEWFFGEATEESFAKLAEQYSTDGGSNTNGGLYEEVYPGQMVTNFNDWCFDESRKPGDTGVVESTYGYHVMFYSSEDEDVTYRDYMIEEDLRSGDLSEWYNGLLEKATVEEKNTDRVNKDIVLSSST